MSANRRIITGYSNPSVKALRALREKKHRKREKKFLAEGLRLLTDARECGHIPETLVLADKRDPHPLLTALEEAVDANGGEVIETSPDILSKITGKDNAQAVAGVFAEFDTSLSSLKRDASNIWLVAQALRDPGNLGTMLRTGDAVGAGGLILIDDCADPFGVEAVRGLDLRIGMSTAGPQLAPDSSYYNPFYNRYTAVYLDLVCDLDGVVGLMIDDRSTEL